MACWLLLFVYRLPRVRFLLLVSVLVVVLSQIRNAAVSLPDVATPPSSSIPLGSPPLEESRIPSYVFDRLLYNSSSFEPLLSVPFYVYSDLSWSNATIGNQSIHQVMDEQIQNPKHADDYWFYISSLKHPMRVFHPQHAKLFVVPPFLNTAFQSLFHKLPLCKNQTLCDWDLIHATDQQLGHSPYFQRSNGSDHILVRSHYKITRLHNLHQCNLISFEDYPKLHPDRSQFPSFYVGRACPNGVEEKRHNFVFIGNLLLNHTGTRKFQIRKRANFQRRRTICHWLETESHSFHVPVCGSGDPCPALAQAQYGFHIRGDTWGANRLLDTLLSGTVPIFTHAEQYSVLPDFIDWKQLSVLLEEDVFETPQRFLQALQGLVELSSYDDLLQTILAHRDLLDWRTGLAFDVYMYMFQKELWPNTITTQPKSTRFSALLL